MKHKNHLLRAGAILFGVALVFFIVRAIVMPKSFGKYGSFRGDNLAEQAALPVVHGTPESCAECHEDQVKTKTAGKHAAVPCQTCHGPLATHVKENGMEPMVVNRSYALCARCHQKLEARPKTFPQIDMQEHVEGMGMKLEDNEAVCLTCHQPHSPALTEKNGKKK